MQPTLLEIEIHTVNSVESSYRTIATMALAFSQDPAARWLFPDGSEFTKNFSEFVQAFAGKAFAQESAFYTDDFTGSALWLGPGVSGDEEAVISLISERVPEERLNETFAVFSQMDEFHPEFPHWYLPLIGVDPIHHGNGHGSALLRHVLEECDRTGIPAYLESSSPANISLYERHGFNVIGEIQAGSSPVIYPMLRPG